ncbi:MAG: nucleoside deaminase [Alphaproteobacteria bacterium]|nr:nucleoside deaminase [Alphaproteobacteria bacterium]
MTESHEHFMGLALEEARRSLAEGNPAVGSVIVKDGKVVGRGRNRVNADQDPTAHGEVDAIRNACRAAQAIRIDGATLYTTMEPCPMCAWAIVEAGIGRLVLGGRHTDMKRTDIGTYSVESLMALTARRLDLVTGVRSAEGVAVRKQGLAAPKAG